MEQLTAAVQSDRLKDRITRATYDAANRNVFTVDAEGGVSEVRYDDRPMAGRNLVSNSSPRT